MVGKVQKLSSQTTQATGTPIRLSTKNMTDQERLRAASEGLRAAGSILRDYAKGTSDPLARKQALALASKFEKRDPREMMDGPRRYDLLFKGLTDAEIELFAAAQNHAMVLDAGLITPK